jgi:hypothetical protein
MAGNGELIMGTNETEDTATQAADKSKRIISSIDFPYSDLDSAVDLVRTIHTRAGMSCETEQLAGWMDQSASGGTFRSRTSAAKMFGLTQSERGQIGLSPLGLDILDGAKERAARVTAFLNVPLYSAMYEQYKGYSLPPPPAIQRQMVTLGVSAKQADRARQVFTKSAMQANFIDPGSGRFIKPSVGAVEPSPPPKSENEGRTGNGGGGPIDLDLDPLLIELLKKIPSTEDGWPSAKRLRWFRTFAMNVSEIYDTEGEPVELKIEMETHAS